jgi:hypothetical protein
MRTSTALCRTCGHGARYRFAGGGAAPVLLCTRHAVLYGPVVQRALEVSAVVGTILFVINQLDVVLSGRVTLGVMIKIGLTYLVPYLVSTYSALEINRLPGAAKTRGQPPAATPREAA